MHSDTAKIQWGENKKEERVLKLLDWKGCSLNGIVDTKALLDVYVPGDVRQ
jgi:hypothetical protein